ncbi:MULTISPECIES: hypothetical protein [Exiguobacterium]|uniref:hypothetical protein n=1 Tax=Exiguobacterium TaxID=33986 RepID=UPI00263B4FBF|nr:hypothetical protein [Exiguobacterium sp.]MCC5893792.1 hypothetical protein [Exiguobacterium sp.]
MELEMTCFFEHGDYMTFSIYAPSREEAIYTFEQQLAKANPANDYIQLSDAKRIRVGDILAYRIEEVKPPLLNESHFG